MYKHLVTVAHKIKKNREILTITEKSGYQQEFSGIYMIGVKI